MPPVHVEVSERAGRRRRLRRRALPRPALGLGARAHDSLRQRRRGARREPARLRRRHADGVGGGGAARSGARHQRAWHRVTKTVHVGLVGAGRIGAFHARTLSGLDTVERLTIADADPAVAERVAAEVGAESAPSPEALVDAGVDALVIAAPTPAHATLPRLAAAAGLPAFCEKPVALELADARRRRSPTSTRPGSSSRSASSGASTPATARRATPSRAGALGTLLVLRAATHDPAPAARGVHRRAPAASSATCTSTTSTRSASSPGARSSRCTRTARCSQTPWFAEHDDVDAATAVLRLDRRHARDRLRHAARPARLRRPARGLRHRRQHRRRRRRAHARSAPSSPASARRDAATADFIDRFEPPTGPSSRPSSTRVRNGGESPCTLAGRARRARGRARRRPLARRAPARSRRGEMRRNQVGRESRRPSRPREGERDADGRRTRIDDEDDRSPAAACSSRAASPPPG